MDETINMYETLSGSRQDVKESEVVRIDGQYVDVLTGEPVVLNQELSGSALRG